MAYLCANSQEEAVNLTSKAIQNGGKIKINRLKNDEIFDKKS